MYCGQKIVLDVPESAKEHLRISRYEELCGVALEAENYDDLARYADQVLEIDPRNASAWIYKAHVAFARSTTQQDRSEEATRYLSKAAETAPNDDRISQVLERWGPVMCQMYLNAAVEHMNLAFNAIFNGSWTQVRRYKTLAMECNLKALHFALNEERTVAILRGIQGLVQNQTTQAYVNFGPEVQTHLEGLEALQNRDSVRRKIRELEKEREELQSILQDLWGKSGFMVRRKIDHTEKRLAALDGELEGHRKLASNQDRILEECGRRWGSAYSVAS
jgi:tetratricopeptide (TPR) repeat protein